MKSFAPPETYSVSEVAAILGVHRLTVYSLIKREQAPFPIVRIGGLIKIPRSAIDKLLDQGADQ